MNIVQVARRFVREQWGGTETVILETSKCLLNQGHQTQIICPNALASRDFESMHGVDVIRAPYFYPYLGLSREAKLQLDKKGGNLFSLSLMRRLGRQPNLDLLHCHTGKRLGGIVRYIARRRRIPYLVSLHGGVHDVPKQEADTWTAPTRKSIEWGKALGWFVGSRRVLDDAAAIICVGQREQELTQQKYPHKRVIYLPNGVDVDRFATGHGPRFRSHYGIPADATVVTIVGRIDAQKNQRLAVRALPGLLESHPRLHLAMIGHVTNNDYLRQLRESIAELNLERRVTIVPGLDPATDMLRDAYHGSDIFLLPSTHEPFGIVILEAWAARVPVVASSVGGVRAVVSPGNDALTFDSDQPEGMVRSIRELLDSPSLRRRLTEEGFRKARSQYSWNTITQRLVDIYSEVLT